MIINITFKTCDALNYGIQEALKFSNSELTEDELYGKCCKWIEYGEYVNIQIDTDKMTAIVLGD